MEKNDLYEIIGLGTGVTTLDITEMNVEPCYMNSQSWIKSGVLELQMSNTS